MKKQFFFVFETADKKYWDRGVSIDYYGYIKKNYSKAGSPIITI
jgi:hypothetical protein